MRATSERLDKGSRQGDGVSAAPKADVTGPASADHRHCGSIRDSVNEPDLWPDRGGQAPVLVADGAAGTAGEDEPVELHPEPLGGGRRVRAAVHRAERFSSR